MTDALNYIAEGLRGLAVPIDDLHTDPANARTNHALDRIAASLKAYGQRKPVIANRQQSGKIEAGNGTWLAAKERLGWTHIAASIGDLFTGFEAAELDDLIRGVSAATPAALTDPETDPSRAEELLAKWQVQVGQVWLCGPHRIMCGDSTQRTDVARLMAGALAHIIWSDPPWNVAYGEADHPSYGTRTMNNDNLGEKFAAFVDLFVTQMRAFCEPGAPAYIVMGGQEWPVIDAALRKIGFHWSSTIVWVKDQLVMSRKDYHTQYEPMWYGWDNRAPRLVKVENRKISDVWMIDRPKKSEEHPTMKPLELVERSLLNSSVAGALVLDLFAGSGTTLLACERTGRVCRTMDNDPKFVAVCLERWSVATCQQPTLESA